VVTKNKVQYGLSNFHYAILDEAAGTYSPPVAVPGAVKLSLSPEGDSTSFPADNIPYFVATSNKGYTGDLEMALFPDAMVAALAGAESDTNGMLVEIADAVQKPFALLCDIEGDQHKRHLVWYNCKMGRPKDEYSTTDKGVEVKTQTAAITAIPVELDGKSVVKGSLELSATNQLVYDAFFTTVLLPDFPAV